MTADSNVPGLVDDKLQHAFTPGHGLERVWRQGLPDGHWRRDARFCPGIDPSRRGWNDSYRRRSGGGRWRRWRNRGLDAQVPETRGERTQIGERRLRRRRSQIGICESPAARDRTGDGGRKIPAVESRFRARIFLLHDRRQNPLPHPGKCRTQARRHGRVGRPVQEGQPSERLRWPARPLASVPARADRTPGID